MDEVEEFQNMSYEIERNDILKEGFLVKKGHIRHNWKSRWFVLLPNVLCYFKSKGESVPKGIINLKGCSVISPDPEYVKKEYVFRLIEILGTEYLLQGSNETERDSWVQEIGAAIRKLDTLTKTNSIKVSNRETLDSPAPDFVRKSTNSPILVILQNRVTHSDLMVAMQDNEAGITLRNHQLGADVYKLCFSGEALISWLLSWAFVKSREEGRIIAGELMEEAFIHPVGPVSETSVKRKAARKAFCDTNDALYRFSSITPNSGLDVDFDLSDSSEGSDEDSIIEDLQATVLKQGFLVKKGHVRHNWKVRKFILFDEPARLSYYNPTKDKKSKKGRIKILGAEVKALVDEEDKSDTSCARGAKNVVREHCFLIQTRKGVKYILQAPSEDEVNNWVKLLQKVIQKYEEPE